MQFTLSCKSGSRTIVHQFNTEDEHELDNEYDSFVQSCKISTGSLLGEFNSESEDLYSGIDVGSSGDNNSVVYSYDYEQESNYSLNGQTDVPAQPTYRVDSIYEQGVSGPTWPFPEGSRP